MPKLDNETGEVGVRSPPQSRWWKKEHFNGESRERVVNITQAPRGTITEVQLVELNP